MQPVYIRRIASIHPPKGHSPGNNRPYLQAYESDYKDIITNATLCRRMSRIVKMGVVCGLECMGELPPEKIQGTTTAAGLGYLTDTEKFLNNLLDNKERMLNPTPSIQSTFDTIGAQIALIHQIHAYNMTCVHRGFSFESTLLDAVVKIREGSESILVGAIDEMTETCYTIQQRLGTLKGIAAGEGARFFLLSREAGGHPLAEVQGVETFIGKQTTEETSSRVIRFLQRNGLECQDIQWLATGKNKKQHNQDDSHEQTVDNGNSIYEELETNIFPESVHLSFKNECGKYPTAASCAVWKTMNESVNCTTSTHILVYNHHHSINHSSILIRKSV